MHHDAADQDTPGYEDLATGTGEVTGTGVTEPTHPSLSSSVEDSPSPKLIGLSWLDVVDADPHEMRALELEAVSRHANAARVRQCGTALNSLWGNRSCKQRLCPGCGDMIAWRNAQKLRVRIGMMQKPRYVLASVRTAGLGADNIQESISVLRHAILRLRRQCFGQSVPAGAGAIELRRSDDGAFFMVHTHLCLDVVDELDEVAATAEWKKATTFKGKARGNIQWHGPITSVDGFSFYSSKPQDWSPPPGSVSPQILEMIRLGVKRRRLLIAWPQKLPFSG